MALFAPSLGLGATGKVLFYYDEASRPVVRLDRISPMEEGLKAILAMYALQNGAGCEGGVDNLSCALTDALNLGGQCSERHVALVGAWFKGGIPKMSGYSPALYQDMTPANLKSICYNHQPTGATFQNVWDIIRVNRSGHRVLIYAHGGWSAREESGTFSYVSEYEIGPGTVTLISHEDKSPKEKK